MGLLEGDELYEEKMWKERESTVLRTVVGVGLSEKVTCEQR